MTFLYFQVWRFLMLSAPSNLSFVPSPHRDTLKALTYCHQTESEAAAGISHSWLEFLFPSPDAVYSKMLALSVCFSWVPWQIGCFQKNQVQCSNCMDVGVHMFIHPAITNAHVLCDRMKLRNICPGQVALKSSIVRALKSQHLYSS